MTVELSYAALLGAIARDPDDLTVKGAFVDWCKENEEFVRAEIAAAMAEVPDLTIFGSHHMRRPPSAEDRAVFDRNRAALADAVEPFARAVAWGAGRRWAPKAVRRQTAAERAAGLEQSAAWWSYATYGALLAAGASLRHWHWAAGCGAAVRKKRRPSRRRPAPPA